MEQDVNGITPICVFCKHLDISGKPKNVSTQLKVLPTPGCKAFPAGIPYEITTNGFDHRTPHPDDNGIQFEKYETKAMLFPLLAELSDEQIKDRMQGKFDYLEQNRKRGGVLPPIIDESNKQSIMTVLRNRKADPDDSEPEYGFRYIPHSLLEWVIEQTEQLLEARRKSANDV